MKLKIVSEEEELISACSQRVSSLLELIPRIQTFKGKWSMMRTKLCDLQGHLSDLSDSPPNPLSLDLLKSISLTLDDAVSLAHSCHLPNLHTQSHLHSLLSSLHRHLSHSHILLHSGLLHPTTVLASPREALRSEFRTLVTRLQIGAPDSRRSAMDSLLRLLHEDDKNVVIAVAQGVVPVLARLLDSPDLRDLSVSAISRVSLVETSRHVLIAEGLLLLNHLLRVLDSGTGFAKERACVALQALSISTDNATTIGSRGGVASLLHICLQGTPASQAIAAGVLRNLALVSEITETFVEENAVVVLLGVSASGTPLARQNAIACLSNLVSHDDNLKVLVVREGGVECLKSFWDSAPSEGSLEVAVQLLRHLASCPPVADILVAHDFLCRLAAVLNCGVLGVRIGAALTVYELGFCTKTRKEMGDCGCIAPLVKMLDGKAAEEKEAAAKALSLLVLYAGNRRILRRDERGIVSVVLLLGPSGHNLDKKYPVSILDSLVNSKKCRKQMVAAGACVYLQKLVELEVEGAKKLSESLGRGKIWGVFSRP